MEFVKGQRVHVLLSANEMRGCGDTDRFARGTITRVGRKYVYVTLPNLGAEIQFDKNGYQVTDYSGDARRLMDDDMRAKYERSLVIDKRFRALQLGGIIHDLNRFSLDTLETVLAAFEADEARGQS